MSSSTTTISYPVPQISNITQGFRHSSISHEDEAKSTSAEATEEDHHVKPYGTILPLGQKSNSIHGYLLIIRPIMSPRNYLKSQ
jgi:hypothetical protein